MRMYIPQSVSDGSVTAHLLPETLILQVLSDDHLQLKDGKQCFPIFFQYMENNIHHNEI